MRLVIFDVVAKSGSTLMNLVDLTGFSRNAGTFCDELRYALRKGDLLLLYYS